MTANDFGAWVNEVAMNFKKEAKGQNNETAIDVEEDDNVQVTRQYYEVQKSISFIEKIIVSLE